MQQKKLLINILVSVLAIAGLVAVYYFFSGGTDTESVGLSTAQTAGEANALSSETSEFLILLEALQSVDLDGKIFENRIFASDLINFTTDIELRPQGRANPFASFGVGNLSLADQVETLPFTTEGSESSATGGETDTEAVF